MSAQTDRELLELAAKAAGVEWKAHTDSIGGAPALRVVDAPLGMWSPLTDDGDALRLAVALDIAIRHDDPSAVMAGWSGEQDGAPTVDGRGPWYWKEWIRDHGNDLGACYAATRRAIVRAAAATGQKGEA
jgi:hypothetical protein